jgi:hypothetical protein
MAAGFPHRLKVARPAASTVGVSGPGTRRKASWAISSCPVSVGCRCPEQVLVRRGANGDWEVPATEGAIVTIDMGASARNRVEEQKAQWLHDTEVSQDTTVDGDHGRIETRTTTVIHDVEWLQHRHDRPGLNAVVVVDSSKPSVKHCFISPR